MKTQRRRQWCWRQRYKTQFGVTRISYVLLVYVRKLSISIQKTQSQLGMGPNGQNSDVKMETMSSLSCVPALILLNGALNHYGLRPVYVHPGKAEDALMAQHQCASMSQTIWLLIKEPTRDQLERQHTKLGKLSIGYTRADVLSTTNKPGAYVAKDYIWWYNLNKFPHMPNIRGVRESNIIDQTKVPKIGMNYWNLLPQLQNP